MAYFFDEERPLTIDPTAPDLDEEAQELSEEATPQLSTMNQTDGQVSRATVGEIKQNAELLVETINSSRALDQQMMESYQKKLPEKLSEIFSHFNDLLVSVYEENNTMLEMKLAELTEILNNCHRLNQELLEATKALSQLKESI